MGFWICATCAVEHADRPEVCAICADERQWVPEGGQRWTTLAEMADAGHRVRIDELEPDLYALTGEPKVGIGHSAKLVCTPAGNLLWDPIGYVDDDAAGRVRALGGAVAVVASHPHHFGVQVEWSRALGGVPVLVSAPDREWVARPDPAVEYWSGRVEPLPGVTLTQPGGHFPGSSVVHWAAGAEGRGVLLCADTMLVNPDRASVAFPRSVPNHIPLSPAVAARIARAVDEFAFDRLYGNFLTIIDRDARAVVRRSAERHAGWAGGAYDDLT